MAAHGEPSHAIGGEAELRSNLLLREKVEVRDLRRSLCPTHRSQCPKARGRLPRVFAHCESARFRDTVRDTFAGNSKRRQQSTPSLLLPSKWSVRGSNP